MNFDELKQSSAVLSITFSTNDLFATANDNEVIIWETRSGKKLHTLLKHTSTIFDLSFSPDGSSLVSGSKDKSIIVWDTSKGEERMILKEHTDVVRAVSYSKDGTTIASGGDDKIIIIWNAHDGSVIHKLKRHRGRVFDLSISPSTGVLASCSEDESIRLWDIGAGQYKTKLSAGGFFLYKSNAHSDTVFTIRYSNRGNMLASGGDDEMILLWDGATGGLIKKLKRHTAGIYTLAFSMDDSILASAGKDRTILIWNANTGEFIQKLIDNSVVYWSLAFSPVYDGLHRLVSGDRNGEIKIFSINRNILNQRRKLLTRNQKGDALSRQRNPNQERRNDKWGTNITSVLEGTFDFFGKGYKPQLGIYDSIRNIKLPEDSSPTIEEILEAGIKNSQDVCSTSDINSRRVQYSTILYTYTADSDLYGIVCKSMRQFNEEDSKDVISQVIDYIYHLDQALQTCKSYFQRCYRAISVDVPLELNTYVPNSTVTWQAFSSATRQLIQVRNFLRTNEENPFQLHGTVFLIKSGTSYDVSEVSWNPNEAEVVFKPNTHFKVLRAITDIDDKTIELEPLIHSDEGDYDISNIFLYELEQF